MLDNNILEPTAEKRSCKNWIVRSWLLGTNKYQILTFDKLEPWDITSMIFYGGRIWHKSWFNLYHFGHKIIKFDSFKNNISKVAHEENQTSDSKMYLSGIIV